MPLSVLVAEDNVAIRCAIQDYLELSGGYSVISTRDGEEALQQLSRCHPNLIIADIKMPRLDGYEFVKQLRQRPEFRLIPVVFLTECNETDDRIQGYKVGCDAYLPKPFELEELLAVVQNLLARSQVMQTELRFAQYPPRSSVPIPESPAPEPSEIPLGLAVEPLTSRETEVLGLLIQGCSNTEMGKALHLSPRTVEKYVSQLLRKTQTPNRTTLVRFAMEHHLLPS